MFFLASCSLTQAQESFKDFGFPSFKGSYSVMIFGQEETGTRADYLVQTLLTGWNVKSVEHQWIPGPPETMVSELHFADQDFFFRVKSVRSFDGEWQVTALEREPVKVEEDSSWLGTLTSAVSVVGICMLGLVGVFIFKQSKVPSLLPMVEGPAIELTPPQKAAVLLMCLPPENSAVLFSHLTPEEVQSLTLEITNLPRLTSGTREALLSEVAAFSAHDSNRVKAILEEDFQRAEPVLLEWLRSLGVGSV